MIDSGYSDEFLTYAADYGMPLYVYDADIISRQINDLKHAFHGTLLDIRYASKAQNTIAILKHIHSEGCGIDTVSPGEMLMALKAGIPPSCISFTPSGVMYEEYAFAIQHGVHIHVDQLHVLEWLDKHYPGTSITLRFNPGVRAGGHEKLQVGSDGSKFGFPQSQLDEVVALINSLSLKVIGVHMHLGSDISDSDSFDQAYDYLLKVAMRWKTSIEHIDLGGGFKIPYHPDDHSIDILTLGSKVSQRFQALCHVIGRDIKLVLEPGKFLVSEAGVLLMQVTGLRETEYSRMIYVQSGFNHFLRPMNYGAYHHIINISNPNGELKEYDVVGYLCETDTFAYQRSLNEVRQGDVLCLYNAGAYGYTMSSNYNGRPRPAELLVKDGTSRLIRRSETIEDLLQTNLQDT
ncbi:MAG: diaminopimelate decarboxylase [Bacteroidota bacterium]|nr:diaminopimelate decarboxylase [Bacteroidota bacterium]